MAKKYIVKPGDWLSKIALQHGFRDGGKAIWNANPNIQKLAGNNPEVLAPGWELLIPDHTEKETSRGTSQNHAFQISLKKKDLHLTLQDPAGKGADNWDFMAFINNNLQQGKSNEEGELTLKDIPQSVSQIELVVNEARAFGAWAFPPEIIHLELGSLDPVIEGEIGKKSIQKILRNLGYYKGEPDGIYGPLTRAALTAFQHDYKLTEHGWADDATCKQLVKAQGNLLPPPKPPEQAPPASKGGSSDTASASSPQTLAQDTGTSPQLLVEKAKQYIGTTEVGGDNSGPLVEEFQKVLGGPAEHQAWCLAFAQYCVKQVDTQTGKSTWLYPTLHCMTLWAKTPVAARLSEPEPGCLIVWEHYKDNKPDGKGHVGIVVRVLDKDHVETIEGNTSPGVKIAGEDKEREGDGVYQRTRSRSGMGTLKVKGFLRAWKPQSTDKPTAGKAVTTPRAEILPVGSEAEHKTKKVTTRAEYLDPTDLDQGEDNRRKLPRFRFFPLRVHVAPCDPNEGAKNPNVVRMPARKFIFLDCGHWQENNRDFGLISGKHVYLCEYVPDKPKSASQDTFDAKGKEGLDVAFLQALPANLRVKQRASASWAATEDFDWNTLLVIIPDLHLMTGEIGNHWKPRQQTIGEKYYDLQAEIDLLEFARKLTGLAELKSHIRVVQLGDSFDLWVGAQVYGLNDPKKPLFQEDEKHRTVKLAKPEKENIQTLCRWIRDMQGLDGNWVTEVFNHRKELEKYTPFLQASGNSSGNLLNPAEAAFRMLEAAFGENLIYIYGNHDNYLALPEVCKAAGLTPRLRWYDKAPGIFIEHGQRLESTFFVAPGYNYDGCLKGYNLTCKAYQGTTGEGSWIDRAMGAAGKPITQKWASINDQTQYIGEYAQVWLGRQASGNATPPHVFVIGHTHLPNLWTVDIDAWRMG